MYHFAWDTPIVNYSLDTMSGLFLFIQNSDKLSLIEGAFMVYKIDDYSKVEKLFNGWPYENCLSSMILHDAEPWKSRFFPGSVDGLRGVLNVFDIKQFKLPFRRLPDVLVVLHPVSA